MQTDRYGFTRRRHRRGSNTVLDARRAVFACVEAKSKALGMYRGHFLFPCFPARTFKVARFLGGCGLGSGFADLMTLFIVTQTISGAPDWSTKS